MILQTELMILLNPFPDICFFHSDPVSEDTKNLHSAEILRCQQFKSDQRRLEYISGRRCAHFAMEKAGFYTLPILTNGDRSPHWPSAIVGSITHSSEYAAALIVAPGYTVRGVGIDIENLNRPINPNISKHVLSPEEIKDWFSQGSKSINNLKIIFSIKECIFKCYYPGYKVYLGFQDAIIKELTDNNFKAMLVKCPITGSPAELEISGNIQITGGLILSSIIWL